jgi:hypothetical protein
VTRLRSQTTDVGGSARSGGFGRAPTTLAVAGFAFALYAATLNPYPSWDALRYAYATAAHAPSGLTSAHHPLGGLLAYALYRAAHLIGWPLDALRALQLTSALGGAVTIAATYAVLCRAGALPIAALGTALALAGSLAFWEVATDGEVYAVATAALMVAWWQLLAVARGGGAAAVGAGAASGVAILGHQFDAVLLPWSALCFRHAARPVWGWTIYAASTAATTLAGYLIAWRMSSWSGTWYGFFSWATHYVRVDFHFPASNPVSGGLRGLLASVVPFFGGLEDLAAAAVVAAVVGVGVAAAVAGWRGCAHPVASAAALAALTAAALAACWEPGTRKFWVPTLVCGWLAMGLALVRTAQQRGGGLVLCAAAIGLFNVATVMLPRATAGANPYRDAAQRIAAVTAPQDLIVVGTDILGPTVAYYAARPHVTNLFAIYLGAAARGRDGESSLHHLIAAAHARNGRVFLSSDALLLSAERRAMVDAWPASAEQLLGDRRRVPVLRYTIAGSLRILFEVGPASR